MLLNTYSTQDRPHNEKYFAPNASGAQVKNLHKYDLSMSPEYSICWKKHLENQAPCKEIIMSERNKKARGLWVKFTSKFLVKGDDILAIKIVSRCWEADS